MISATERTAALLARFERQVDPGRELPAAERARRAQDAARAHFKRMGVRSGEARRTKAQRRRLIHGLLTEVVNILDEAVA